MGKIQTVWFVVKKNGHGYLHHYTTEAKDRKEAFQNTEEYCQSCLNAHAFGKTTKKPETSTEGITFGKMLYPYAQCGNGLSPFIRKSGETADAVLW